MAIFKPKHLQKILEGQKTQTRRTHKYGWQVGRVYGLRERWFQKAENHILITRKFRQRLGDITLADAEKEGYASLEDFRNAWEEIYGPYSWYADKVVTVYEFRLVSHGAKTGRLSSASENRRSL